MTEQSILEKGKKVFLRTLSNLSAGGDPIDETDHLPNEVKQIAIDSLKVLPSIPHAGVDIIVNEDRPSESVLLEVNATAEIAFHLFPITGKSRDVPKAIVDYYFTKTTKRKKSQFYFDYESLLEPLRTWSAAEISVMLAPRKKLNGMKYIIEGDFDRDSFKEWIKRLALRRKLHGYIKDLTDNKVEVFVVGTNPKRFETFLKVIEKGNKTTTINNIKYEAIKKKKIKKKKTNEVQIGFQIKKKTKKEDFTNTRKKVKQVATGDVLLQKRVYNKAKKQNGYDFTSMFENIEPLFEKEHLTVVNL